MPQTANIYQVNFKITLAAIDKAKHIYSGKVHNISIVLNDTDNNSAVLQLKKQIFFSVAQCDNCSIAYDTNKITVVFDLYSASIEITYSDFKADLVVKGGVY